MIHLVAVLALVSPDARAGESGGVDHALFTAFLDGAVSTAGVDYAALAARRDKLDAYLKQVAAASTDGLSAPEKLALYVNAYNANTLALVLDHGAADGSLKSIRDLDGGNPWDTRKFEVAGGQLTLNQMEHEHARKLADGRVHAVVNCASKGCPPLPPKALTAAGLEAQLDAAARTWANHNAYALDGSTLRLSKIFDWYGDDFVGEDEGDLPGVDGKAEDAVWFLADKVGGDVASRLKGGGLAVDWLDYDWSLNRR